MHWRTVNPESLCWAQWDDANTLFHGETGETHLLGELPAAVVQLLSGAARSEASLCAELAALCETANDGPWRQRIAALLSQLETLELIEPLPADTP
jgi:PqqD family protein of HPr-rel-A system